MTSELFNEIPKVDLADFTKGDASAKAKFVEKVGEAFRHVGFLAVKNHYLPPDLEVALYREVTAFFSMSDDIKSRYEIPGINGQRGYTGKQKEHAKDNPVGDLKEFFHVGQVDSNPFGYPANVTVDEVPGFNSVTRTAYKCLEDTGIELLRAIALHLRLEENYFDEKVKMGNSILRAIHYFPIENPEAIPSDAVRAAAHGDINLITLLMGASAEGLEILRKDGKWIPVTALPGYLVVNVGDMLERHTNNMLKSTIHRVVNPPREKMKTSRYSIPFFMHPVSSMKLDCLDNCIDADNPKQYEPITAGDFLYQRLVEIGLIK